MPETDQPDIDEIIEQARRKMTVTTPDNTDYNEVRQLHNQRLQTYPRAIAHCENADHFSWWMRALKDIEIPISIRSGGHHHEAMSSNDGGVVLLSNPAKHIEISDDLKYVWLGSGQRLGNVIDELAKVQRLMPTGGCETVCVGGLTHGGGWGLSYRVLGATVDKLIEVEMVLQNGEIVIFNNNDFLKGDPKLDVSAKDLYWAICGGGGGTLAL